MPDKHVPTHFASLSSPPPCAVCLVLGMHHSRVYPVLDWILDGSVSSGLLPRILGLSVLSQQWMAVAPGDVQAWARAGVLMNVWVGASAAHCSVLSFSHRGSRNSPKHAQLLPIHRHIQRPRPLITHSRPPSWLRTPFLWSTYVHGLQQLWPPPPTPHPLYSSCRWTSTGRE